MPVPTIKQPVPKLDITIKRRADFMLALCIIERDETGARVVVDTAGWIVVMQVREEPYPAGPVIVEASTANGRIVTGINGDPGEEVNIDIKIPSSITAGITHTGKAGYDILTIAPDGTTEYLCEGRAFLQPSYTW